MEWLNAHDAGGEPKLDGPGVIHRLKGGRDPSLSDPYATDPGSGAEWTELGPHIVILPGDQLDPAAHGTDHHGSGPCVLWPGMPYEHLRIPVR
jgi:hypothetical protein